MQREKVKSRVAVINKKIWPEYFEAVLSGKKNYEQRLNDFDVEEGDTLVLDEWIRKLKSTLDVKQKGM